MNWSWSFRLRPQETPSVADLSTDGDAIFTVLADSEAWRVRVVEQVSLGSALSCTARRSLQVAPLHTFLPQLQSPVLQQARLILPVATLPKRPLLRFDVTLGDGTPLHLLSRRAIAEVEAEYVRRLAERDGVPIPHRLMPIVTAICEFTPGPWLQVRNEATYAGDHGFEPAMSKYLADGIGIGADLAARPWTLPQLPPLLSSQWKEVSDAIGAICRWALDEGKDPDSSAENVRLVVPMLLDNGIVDSVEAVFPALEEFRDYLLQLYALQATAEVEFRPSGAVAPVSEALVALADYGRRWEALVQCTVPTREPFLLKMKEDRPLQLGLTGRAEQRITLGDANSYHFSLRVDDVSVEVGSFAAHALDERPLTHDYLATSLRASSEIWAFYASHPSEYRIDLRFRLRTSWPVTASAVLLECLTWLALFLVVQLAATLTADDLAVLVVPTTFAATLLLTRERTSLASRLMRATRWRTGTATVLLWAVVATLYLLGWVPNGGDSGLSDGRATMGPSEDSHG